MEMFIWYVGCLASFYLLIKFSLFIWKLFRGYLLTKYGFVVDLRKYGKWAVVTGATDGIGKEYAKQLARKGFDVVLFGRSTAKLEAVVQEIQEDTSVDTKSIVFDFSKNLDYSLIEKDLVGLDIGILVNNVGTSHGNHLPFQECEMQKLSDIVMCNVFSDVCLTNIVMKGMVKRKRGAIVHVSSGSILLNGPGLDVYPATKCFMDKLATSLQYENDGVIHHQLLIPMYVATKLSRKKQGFTIPTPEEYVCQAIRTIEILQRSCGYWSHEIIYVILHFIPNVILNIIIRMIQASKKLQ